MKKVFKFIAGLIFMAFIAGVALWTASLTLAEVRHILPGDEIAPYFALMLYDGGAVAWLGAWLFLAQGIPQRGISLVMLIIDLLGVVLLSAGRLFMGGQTLTEAPEYLGVTVIYGLVLSTLLNLAAIYAYHASNPDNIEAIETAILEDTLRAEALTQAKATIEHEAQQLGAVLAARATGRLKYRLGLPMGDIEAAAVMADQTADNEQPAQPLQIIARPHKVSPLSKWIVNAGSKIWQAFIPAQTDAQTYQATTQQPPQINPTPADVPADEGANPTQPGPGAL